jgi:uncharacterized pyridoxamine 5'-phosphate oxidase family protein
VKVAKRTAIALLVYMAMVATFESLLGFFQPEAGSTVTITTLDASGSANDRVLSLLESGGQMYVAANHWPRAWYRQALSNPKVEVMIEGSKDAYLAVPVVDATEHDRVQADNDTGLMFRILTGFPPRYFIRLDPRAKTSG